MKNLKLALPILVFALLCQTALAAEPASVTTVAPNNLGLFFKPYIGVDYQYIGANYKSIPGTTLNFGDVIADSFHGIHGHVGARVHRNAGFEFGYLWTDEENKTTTTILGPLNVAANVEGFTFDALGYIPVGASEKFEVIGTVGLSILTANVRATVGTLAGAGDETEANIRAGGGFQYWLTDNVAARTLVRYQGADFNGVLDNAIAVNAGLNYQF